MSEEPRERMTPEASRLDELGRRIERARATQPARDDEPGPGAPPAGLGAALRLSTELFAGVAVGFGLGWFVDKGLGTTPFGVVVFVLVGFAAGTINLVRAAGRPKAPSGPAGPGSGT